MLPILSKVLQRIIRIKLTNFKNNICIYYLASAPTILVLTIIRLGFLKVFFSVIKERGTGGGGESDPSPSSYFKKNQYNTNIT